MRWTSENVEGSIPRISAASKIDGAFLIRLMRSQASPNPPDPPTSGSGSFPVEDCSNRTGSLRWYSQKMRLAWIGFEIVRMWG